MEDDYQATTTAPRKSSIPTASVACTPNNVEAMMQKLRKEVLMISTNLTQVKDKTMRQSVSIMEDQMSKNTEVYEKHIKEANEKHKNIVENKAKEYEETIDSLKKQLRDRENVVDKLRGCLEECRTARMEALEELAKTQNYYGEKVKELERCISEGRESIALLQAERDKLRTKMEDQSADDFVEAMEAAMAEVEALEGKIEMMESEMKERDSKIGQFELMKEHLEGKVDALEKENASLRENLEKYIEMSKTKDESDDSVRMLEGRLSKAHADWDETKKQLVLEQTRAEKLCAELAEVQRESALLKVDLRIESRQRKELEKKVEFLSQQNISTSEQMTALESANTTLTTKITSFETEISSLKTQIKTKEDELKALSAAQDELSLQKSQLEQDRASLRNEVVILKAKADEMESIEKVLAQKNEMIDAKMELIEEKNRKIQALQNKVEVLKEVSTLLDTQLKEFEGALDKRLEALKDAEKFKELLETENRDLREQLKNCKIQLNEAKSLKTFTEKKLELTENSLKSENQSKETEVHQLLEKLSVATTRNEELSEELNVLMTQSSELEGEKFELRKELETVKNDKDRMSKEISSLVNTVIQMKDEIITLQDAVKESIGKAEKYKGMHESLLEKYEVLQQAKQTHEVMFTTRIEQQQKLINYLQEQLNALQEKKKKKGLLFTPRKEKEVPLKMTTPLGGFRPTSVPATLVATSLCLVKEKLAVQDLEEKRETLRSRLEDLQQKTSSPIARKSATATLPPQQPEKRSSFVLKEQQSNTLPGGSGKSHRFLESRCEATQKCMSCWDPIYKGRPMSKCEACTASYHLACGVTASKSCGLSEKSVCELEKSVSKRRVGTIMDEVEEVFQGWVTIRTEIMRVAERLFLRIEQCHLNIYETEKSSQPLESLPLNEYTTVYYRLTEKEVNSKSSQMDIAFAMKINFEEADDPEQSTYMYMFHGNKKQKRYWIHGIQKYSKMHNLMSAADSTSGSDLSFCSTDDNKENASVSGIKVNEVVLLEDKSNGKIHVNCVYLLPNTKIYLLGCDDGLYSLKSPGSAMVKIEGPQSVYQIDTLAAVKTAVLIEGPRQMLSTVYMGLLKTCAEAAECSNPKFMPQVVQQTKDCYMIATRGDSLKDTIVASAGNNALYLCGWAGEGLQLFKQINIEDSITTLLMTPHTVIYGNYSIYEVDTKTFEQEPFLDSTDDAVHYVQVLNESNGSYPVAILDVTQSRGTQCKEPEYLVCFQDIGIFVDGFGNRSRECDVLWSSVPIAFEYRHPFLYIFHFTTIEIQKLDGESYTRVHTIDRKDRKSGERVVSRMISPPTRFVAVSPKIAPCYVGKSKAGVVIFSSDAHATRVSEFTAVP